MTKRTMKASMRRFYRTSPGLQLIANVKDDVNLAAVADYFISPDTFSEKWPVPGMDPDEVAEKMNEALMGGLRLATLMQMLKGPTAIWVVVTEGAHGESLFFFVGTYQDVAKTLRGLPDEI